MRVLLIDPSLFTAPYDAHLTQGLLDAGIEPTWAIRPTREGDRSEIASEYTDAFFYRHVDALTELAAPLRAALKGLAHVHGLVQLTARVARRPPDVVHFQWTVVPLLDAIAIFVLRHFCPVVLTIHDTAPYNGDRLPWLQRWAVDLPSRLADRVIVHTRAGQERLSGRGLEQRKLAIIPHGPLALPGGSGRVVDSRAAQGWTFLAFGEIKPYKGLDLLIEALGTLPAALRSGARLVIAGRPCMSLASIEQRIVQLGLSETVELRPRRQTEDEMAELFAQTDCFVFPYRQIDASGVYFLAKPLGRWIIASRVGVFAEEIEHGVQGALIEPADVTALAAALTSALLARPRPRACAPAAEWSAIGVATREIYREARAAWQVRRKQQTVQHQALRAAATQAVEPSVSEPAAKRD